MVDKKRLSPLAFGRSISLQKCRGAKKRDLLRISRNLRSITGAQELLSIHLGNQARRTGRSISQKNLHALVIPTGIHLLQGAHQIFCARRKHHEARIFCHHGLLHTAASSRLPFGVDGDPFDGTRLSIFQNHLLRSAKEMRPIEKRIGSSAGTARRCLTQGSKIVLRPKIRESVKQDEAPVRRNRRPHRMRAPIGPHHRFGNFLERMIPHIVNIDIPLSIIRAPREIHGMRTKDNKGGLSGNLR